MIEILLLLVSLIITGYQMFSDVYKLLTICYTSHVMLTLMLSFGQQLAQVDVFTGLSCSKSMCYTQTNKVEPHLIKQMSLFPTLTK